MLENMTQCKNCIALTRDVSACIFYAIAATVFYKKAFKKELFPSVVIFAYGGMLLDYANFTVEPLLMNVLLITGILCCACLRRNGLVPLKPDVILFLFILLDARWDIINQSLPVQVTYWMRIFFFALPQFVRKPIWLKTKLQEIRAMFGPLYIFCIAVYMPEHSTFMYVMKYAAFILSFVAGVISRPDNSVILTSLGRSTSFSSRRLFHRYLMIASFVGVVAVVLAEGLAYVYLNIVLPWMQNPTSGNSVAASENTSVHNLSCSIGYFRDHHTCTLDSSVLI